MIAGSRGLRASKSSATRGRPPVMSLVFVVSRGIFAMMSPWCTSAPSATRTWAPPRAVGQEQVAPHRQHVAPARLARANLALDALHAGDLDRHPRLEFAL